MCLKLSNWSLTVTDALVLRPLLEDRGHITESVRILMPVDRIKQKCFQSTTSVSPSNAAVLIRKFQYIFCTEPVLDRICLSILRTHTHTQDIMDVGVDNSYVHINMSNLYMATLSIYYKLL